MFLLDLLAHSHSSVPFLQVGIVGALYRFNCYVINFIVCLLSSSDVLMLGVFFYSVLFPYRPAIHVHYQIFNSCFLSYPVLIRSSGVGLFSCVNFLTRW